MKHRMRRMVLVGAAVIALGVIAPVAAGHDHYLTTPGTCVEDIGQGQTAQTSGGGAHRFHDNIHLGQPGTVAFANPSNPVAVYKDGTGPGCE